VKDTFRVAACDCTVDQKNGDHVNVRIYHNPRCSKSRETLALLESRGVEPEVVEYLKTPLTALEVKRLIGKLGIAPGQLLRSGEDAYKTLKLSKASSLEQVSAAIANHPVLLERPIVEVGDRAAIGRPPENVLPLLK
jgi:arsenate reductase (glutaredoxin)